MLGDCVFHKATVLQLAWGLLLRPLGGKAFSFSKLFNLMICNFQNRKCTEYFSPGVIHGMHYIYI